MIHVESMQTYQARVAFSAGMAWDMVKPDDGCPAQAWWDSCFNPARVREEARHFDFGTAVHLAALEADELRERIYVIDSDNYRTKAAQEARDLAYRDGLIPLLAGEDAMLSGIRLALERSDAAELLFGDGRSEVSYSWEWSSVPCKARVDRIAGGHLIDLKTANSASPQAFQRAIVDYGHHLRAAWYVSGWNAGGDLSELAKLADEMDSVVGPDTVNRYCDFMDYRFVVVAKRAPHLVSIFRIEEQALEWGRRLVRKALREFRQYMETGVWPGYCPALGDKTILVGLPPFAEYQLGEMEDEGKL
jgi:PDDEXK-like domain of unknown function (DUF3799)